MVTNKLTTHIFILLSFRDSENILFLFNGGNSRLRKLIEEYNVTENDILIKYNLKCIDYYRNLVKYFH